MLRAELASARERVRQLELQIGIRRFGTEVMGMLAETVDRMHEGIQILSPDWHYLYINLAAAKHGRRDRDELIGRTLMECYPGIELTPMFELLNQTMNDRLPRAMDNQFVYPDGMKCWFELSVEPDPSGILIRTIDITKRKRLEEELLHGQKIDAIGRLVGGIAHDFNNKLGVMLLFCEMALEGLGDQAPTVREYIENILVSVKQSATLTRQLLAFGRKQVLDLKVIHLNDFLRSSQETIQRLMGETVKVEYVMEDELSLVQVDPSQMDQVLLNLCINSRDAMESGGTLIVETANVVLDELYCEIHPEVVPGHYVLLTISDSGRGMSEEIKARVFEPFFTTKESGRGNGLGLSSVHGIIAQSRGHIWLYSEPGVGTTFKIYLPVIRDAVIERGVQPLEKSAAQDQERILLVEDDSLLRSAFQQALRDAGYAITSAASAEEAREIYKAKSESMKFDMLLTDVVLPKETGNDLFEYLKSCDPDLKAVFVSGYTENSIVHHAVLDTESVLIQKPVTTRNLLKTVRSVLDGQMTKGIV